jgi:alpha-tubulin suppressor-like RCC1 family protein
VAVKRGFVWVGLLAAWGCADFNKEEDAYCRDNPAICDGPEAELVAVQSVSSRGQHILALGTDATVWAWGQNNTAQLGDGTVTDRSRPKKLRGLSGIKAVAAGFGHSLALGGGKVWRWGQIGKGQPRMTPEEVPGLSDITDIAAGNSHSLVLHQSGSVLFWGVDGAGNEVLEPTGVNGLPHINEIAAGGAHSLALDEHGEVWAWGDNNKGQLGSSDVETSSKPLKVLGLSGIKAIAAGASHSLAIDGTNRVWTWGDNGAGQLGDGSVGGQRATPEQVEGVEEAEGLAAGTFHSLVRKGNNEILAWGRDSAGQLGDDLLILDKATPVEALGITGAVSIAAGHSSSLAVLSNGCLYAWGSNQNERLGVPKELFQRLVSQVIGPGVAVNPAVITIPVPISLSCFGSSG